MFDLKIFEEKLDAWLEKSSGASDTEWTIAVKNILIEMAPDLPGVNVSASSSNAKWGEWLCDVTWLKYSGNGFGDPLEKLLLVAESEWGDWECILEDFEKLLVCRADTRVMVFDDSKGVNSIETLKKLKKHAEAFMDIEEGDYFVFAYFDRIKDRFFVEDWRYTTHTDNSN